MTQDWFARVMRRDPARGLELLADNPAHSGLVPVSPAALRQAADRIRALEAQVRSLGGMP